MHRERHSYDHYVAQTYLRHFSCAKNKVFVYRKKTGKKRICGLENTAKICGQQGWDICQHLENIYALREFLNDIEPFWNLFVQSIKDRTLDVIETQESTNIPIIMKGILYISYLRVLSPRSIEMAQDLHEGFVNQILKIEIDNNDLLKKITNNSKIQIEYNDFVYFKGFSLNHLQGVAEYFYTRNWDILINNSSTKFITSDNPLIFKNFNMNNGKIIKIDNQFMPLYLPLTPEIALIIRKEEGMEVNYIEAFEEEVLALNEEMVRFASDLVISSCNQKEVKIITWLNKYKDTSLGVVFNEMNMGNQHIITMQQKPIIKI